AILLVPGRDQCVTQDRRAGTPGLAAVEYQRTRVMTNIDPGLRRLGSPHAPSASHFGQWSLKLVHDRQSIGMTFEQFAQPKVVPGNTGQCLPAFKCLTA